MKGADCYASTPNVYDRTRMPVTMMSPDREGGCYEQQPTHWGFP